MNRITENKAFTLVELLVVVSIIAVIATLITPAVSGAMNSAQRTSTLSNMRQLGTMMATYMAQNAGSLPQDKGAANDNWTTIASGQNDNVWYNTLPRMCGMKGVADYATSAAGKAEFYSKRTLFFCPAAKYPSDKLTAQAPYFAIAMNSKLIQSSGATSLGMIQQPSKTVAFLENGLPGETKFVLSQTDYDGQATAFASRFVARYGNSKKGMIIFLDGHATVVDASGIVAPAGKAYYPQLSNGGTVLWTSDPTADANLKQ